MIGTSLRNELEHDKTNKVACAPSNDSVQAGHLPSLISLLEGLGSWVHMNCTAKADLSLRLATGHFAGFVVLRFKFKTF